MNVYQTLYDLVNQYIFNNTVVVNTYQELVCVLVATCGALFVMALPFMLVYKVVRML